MSTPAVVIAVFWARLKCETKPRCSTYSLRLFVLAPYATVVATHSTAMIFSTLIMYVHVHVFALKTEYAFVFCMSSLYARLDQSPEITLWGKWKILVEQELKISTWFTKRHLNPVQTDMDGGRKFSDYPLVSFYRRPCVRHTTKNVLYIMP